MSATLRDFWFPLLLGAAGLPTLFFSSSAIGNARRVMLTITIVCFFLAILSYIWGDPVRGPFANIIRPHDSESFLVVSGVPARVNDFETHALRVY